jgi:hypothetical protein
VLVWKQLQQGTFRCKRCAEAVLLFGRWVCLVSSERRASSYHYVRR